MGLTRSIIESEEYMGIESKEPNLIEDHYDYAQAIAHTIAKRFEIPTSYVEDMIQEAYIGLIEAADKYKEGSKVPFKNFAYLRIRGAIIDHLRTKSDLGRSGYKAAKMFKAVQDFGIEHVKESKETDEEQLSKVLEYMAKGALVFRLSMEETSEEVEKIEEEKVNPEKILSKKQYNKSFKDIIEKTLNEQEKEIIESYYFKDKPFTEMIEKMNISKSWVSRIHKEAINKLKDAYFEIREVSSDA